MAKLSRFSLRGGARTRGRFTVGGMFHASLVLNLILVVALMAKWPLNRSLRISSFDDTPASIATFRDGGSEALSYKAPIGNMEKNFLSIAQGTGTDKVLGVKRMETCLAQKQPCPHLDAINKFCRPGAAHFYHTMYDRWLGPLSRDDADPFQFLEIGFYNGKGFEAFMEFLPKAEAHSMEISCIEPGPRDEGKWPWGNFAEKNKKWYDVLLERKRLHCGDANDVTFLNETWLKEMKRPGAPPLKVVVDDGSHLAAHMVQTVFFWFPRLAPRGLLIVEDIQPIQEANKFRTQFLPQIMADLHFCGDPDFPDEACFPTLQPLLASIHCEMHICVFERNDEPAVELDLKESVPPSNALSASLCNSLKT